MTNANPERVAASPHRRPGAAPGSPLRSAVIGAGAISLEHLPFLKDSERSHLVGVCDLSPASSRIAARRFGADSGYTDVVDMLERAQPDVVHVLTPPHTHGHLVRMCLERGVHVICEKPMAPTAAEARELLDLASSHDLHLVENHNYRFNDEMEALRRLIDDGELGDVCDVEIRMALQIRADGSRFADENLPHPIHGMPAGVIHDFITHFAYLINDLAGVDRWSSVLAEWNNHGGGDLFRFDDLDAILVTDGPAGALHGRLRFSCRTSPDHFSVVVRGTRGEASTDLFHPHLDVLVDRPGGPQLTPIVNHLVNGTRLAAAGVRNFGQKLLQHGPYHGLPRFLDQTYAAIQAGESPPVTPGDILAAAELIDALVAAAPARTGGDE